MARKLYKTNVGIVNLSIGPIESSTGKAEYVIFSGGIREPNFVPATVIVTDPKVQDVLEKCDWFNVKFVLAKAFKEEPKAKTVIPKAKVVEEEEAKPPPPPVITVIKVPQVKTVQGAITNLIRAGADPDGLDTLEDVERVSKKMNIEYPNIVK